MKSLFSILLIIEAMIVFSLQNKIDFHIGALVPYLRVDYFVYKTPIDFAVEIINNKTLLQGHKLVIHYGETGGEASRSIQSLLEFTGPAPSKAIKLCILGPASSKVASYTARLATVWGPLQVSYGASTPELLDGQDYPRFLSVVPSSNSLNRALIKMLGYFKWRRIALVYDVNDKEFFLPTMNALQVLLTTEKFNMGVEEGISLESDDEKELIIKKMKDNDVRIVIALFHAFDLAKVMCAAYKQGFYGKKIVWISYINEPILKRSRDSPCNATEMKIVSERMFVLNFQFYRTDDKKTISGLTVKEFRTQIRLRHPFRIIGVKSSLAFDATWLLALALNASLEDAFTIQNKTEKPDFALLKKLKDKMVEMEFEGISGNVKFTNTERFGTVIIRQRREGRLIDVAQHHTVSNIFTFFPNQSSSWVLFGGASVAKDGPSQVHEVQYYSKVLFIAIWIACTIAILVALGLFHFNFKNREIRYIKMSSPHVNNIIIFGGILCFIKVILDTLDARFLSLEMYGSFCNVRVWIMSLGFSTSFGAMFSKTWRVHRIFTASKNFRRAVIKNFHLYGLLVGLLAVDILLLTLWMIFSPYKSDILHLDFQPDEENDKVVHPSIYHCTSKHGSYFLITTLCYKGLLLIFGIFLAWETRNIEIKALNDSKYIGISVYNVVILSVVGVIIASLMAGTGHYNLYLGLMSTVVLLCTAATLGIVFVPKILGLQRVLSSTANEALETSYTTSTGETDSPCCCCENCRCRCSRRRTSSIHVSNRYLASASNSRSKSRQASLPSISVTKPKVSVHIAARVSLSTSPVREDNETLSESPKAGFLSAE